MTVLLCLAFLYTVARSILPFRDVNNDIRAAEVTREQRGSGR